MQKTVSVKMLAMFMALILVAGGVIGGTVAWLIARTDEVVNTFTFGDINITLDETKVDPDGNPVDEDDDDVPDRITGTDEQNEYKLIPGEEYLKDPRITVNAESEKCWLFATVEEKIEFVEGESGNFGDYLTYDVADGWTELVTDNETVKVYYQVVEYDAENDQYFGILAEDKVSVSEELTKKDIEILNGNPSLAFTAYAVQYSGFEAEAAEGEDPTAEQIAEAALKAWNVAIV